MLTPRGHDVFQGWLNDRGEKSDARDESLLQIARYRTKKHHCSQIEKGSELKVRSRHVSAVQVFPSYVARLEKMCCSEMAGWHVQGRGCGTFSPLYW